MAAPKKPATEKQTITTEEVGSISEVLQPESTKDTPTPPTSEDLEKAKELLHKSLTEGLEFDEEESEVHETGEESQSERSYIFNRQGLKDLLEIVFTEGAVNNGGNWLNHRHFFVEEKLNSI